MPDDHALGEWELHTLKDMRLNDNHQHPIKSMSRDIMNSTRWLMRLPADTKLLIYAHGCSLTAITNRRTSIPKCTLWTCCERHRCVEILYDNNVLIEVKSTLRVGDTLVPSICISDRTHPSNFTGHKNEWPVNMTIGNQSLKIRQMP